MAKRIPMTRERQCALPVILDAARKHIAGPLGCVMDKREKAALEQALEAFQ